MASNLRIAIDLDNTLINYESVFPLAASQENLPSFLSSKEDIKKYLSATSDGHSVWLRIQGKVYGELIHWITPDNSLLDALQTLSRNNELILVSHKTQVSFCQRYNLIQEAEKWLKSHSLHSFFNGIHYFPSKEEKIDWINNQSFDVVIDDLQDILEQLQTSIKIHFSQNTESSFIALNQWSEIASLLELIDNKPLSKISHRTFRNDQAIIKYFPKLKDRFDREVFFLDYLKSEHGVSYPEKAEAISPFIKTIFKEGQKPLDHIDEKFCLLLLSFLKCIEKSLNVNFEATHAISSTEQYISLINERFHPDFQKIIPDIYSLKESVLLRKRRSLNFTSSFCFPDFSKHNFMYDGDKLFLTDFESVGNDEPVRMLLNAIHHLGHSIDKNEVTILLKAFINHYGPETRLKVQSLLDLNALDWLLIGAKRAYLTHDPLLIDELNKKTKYMIECREQGKEYWSWNQDKIYFLNE